MWGMSEREACQRVRMLVRQIKDNLGISGGLRYNGLDDLVAQHLDIKVVHAPLPSDFGKYISDEETGSTIILDLERQSRQKLTFTYFHEITHHILRNDDTIYSWINEATHIENLLERLCDIGAAEFVLPSDDVFNIIQKDGFSIKLIPILESAYTVSKPTILIQMIERANHECYGVICAVSPEKQQMIESAQLYVENSTSSLSSKYPLRKGAVLEHSHLIYDAFQQQSFVTGVARIPFPNGRNWKVDCEALYHKGKVYAFFNISRPITHNPDQLLLL